ncbi:DUF4388 domain-containing protein [Geomonas sp.]|uniref:DUF4388 domain-containing protein n=1 Tax=Geomonas sp. TaxID=2651584 RepID=UPI002B45BC7D|nr:DUF4388 domain-containing protein [Geomonas sp.]HJV33551.1 DUF4388 domain-containing protein [Geomonas sp.]
MLISRTPPHPTNMRRYHPNPGHPCLLPKRRVEGLRPLQGAQRCARQHKKVSTMSFDGDLQHLPIVDVIQLLHATRKSGTLTLRSLKGESQLVFHDGFIVSANHVDNSVRIGQILMDMGLIAYEELESALHEQQKAGNRRRPIIQTMIEAGKINPEEAYQGLEVLIEMTIVEVLSWTRGTFSLDVDKIFVSDEYRFFPEHLEKEIQLDTQNVLMDALRIYDERKRDGMIDDAVFRPSPELPAADESAAEGGDSSAFGLSASDLGLDELEHIERKIHKPFTGLGDAEPETPAKRLRLALPGVPPEELQRLVQFLGTLTERPQPAADGGGVVLCSTDKVVREWVGAACGARFLLATNDAAGVDPIIDQFQASGRAPLLLVDAGEPAGRGGAVQDALLGVLREKRTKYPELPLLLLACPSDLQLNARAVQAGVGAVLPRPSRGERGDSLITDTIECAKALDSYLTKAAGAVGTAKTVPVSGGTPAVTPVAPSAAALPHGYKERFSSFADKREPSEVTLALLQAVGSYFERALTLVVVRTELVSERGIGINAPGELSTVRTRIPVSGPSLFQRALDGESHYGEADPEVRQTISGTLGQPACSKMLLLPVKSFGRVIALIYADFGSGKERVPQLELLEMLAEHAGVVIDNALYRKRCAQR